MQQKITLQKLNNDTNYVSSVFENSTIKKMMRLFSKSLVVERDESDTKQRSSRHVEDFWVKTEKWSAAGEQLGVTVAQRSALSRYGHLVPNLNRKLRAHLHFALLEPHSGLRGTDMLKERSRHLGIV